MKLFPLRLASAFSIFGVFILAANGCSKGCTPSPTERGPTQKQGIQGFPALQFDYKQATELLVSKADPQTGDRWSARIVREGPPSSENENLWSIEMGPDEINSGDRRAYGLYILHLLDTLRTLQVKEAPLSGTPESFGLAPPLFQLKWKVAGSSPSAFDIRFGSVAKLTDSNLQGLYLSIAGDSKVYVAQGSALKMLEMLSTFAELRLKALATFAGDDIDEIEIDPKTLGFYAQRDGARWTNRKHRPLRGDIEGFLDQLTHLRILRFVDDPGEQKKRGSLLTRAQRIVILKDRHGNPTTIRIARQGKQVFANISNRKTRAGSLAVFEVYPEILSTIAEVL